MYHCWQIITVNDVTVRIMDAKTNSNPVIDPLSQLGAKVFRKRKEDLKISQDELIARMNQTVYQPDVARQSHISNIENSDGDKLPSIRVLAALAVALETNVDFLVGLTNDPKPASDLEDQLVVEVRDEEERALLQELFDLIHRRPREEQRFLADVIRRLAAAPASKAPIIIGSEPNNSKKSR